MRHAAALSLLLLSACEQPYHAPILYQAQTPDCRNWADGSRFELPRRVSVFAGAPEQAPDGALQLRIAYFIPRGESVSFASQEFEIVEPQGSTSATGSVAAVDRHAVNAPGAKTEALASLPQTLTALNIGDETMIRVTLLFTSPPKRFDLLHPSMLVGGKPYPVRIYTYRWFEDRREYGLCT